MESLAESAVLHPWGQFGMASRGNPSQLQIPPPSHKCLHVSPNLCLLWHEGQVHHDVWKPSLTCCAIAANQIAILHALTQRGPAVQLLTSKQERQHGTSTSTAAFIPPTLDSEGSGTEQQLPLVKYTSAASLALGTGRSVKSSEPLTTCAHAL